MYSRILPTCTLKNDLIIVQMQESTTLYYYYCMLNFDNWCCWRWCWGCCRARSGSCVNEDFLTFSAHILHTVLSFNISTLCYRTFHIFSTVLYRNSSNLCKQPIVLVGS